MQTTGRKAKQDQRADEEQRSLRRRADCLTACGTKQEYWSGVAESGRLNRRAHR